MFFEEVRIPGGHQTVTGQEAGVAVIGMKAVALPRIVTEHHVRAKFANPVRDLPPLTQSAVEFSIGPTEEHDLTSCAESNRRGALLALATDGECSEVGVGIPRALRAVGAHQVMHHTSGGRPLGQRGAAPEFDIVGMGADS